MTDITKIREWTDEDENDGAWPPPDQHVESLITGALRDRVLVLTDQPDSGQRVTLLETEIEGGYSEFTVEMEYHIAVQVDGTEVWPNNEWASEWEAERAMAKFLAWAAS